MSTTTTIYPKKDTYINQGATGTNYDTSTTLRVGQYASSNRRHGLLIFETSSLSNPADIVSATLTLKESGTFGSSTRTMKICRCNLDFITGEATWDDYISGTAWTGGAGGQGNAAFTEPTYSISVGNSVGDQSVDIKELVIDAMNKRTNGEVYLIICFDPADTGTAAIGNSTFYSLDDATESNRPKLEVVTATRKVWTGARDDGDLTTSQNWSPTGVPSSTDYAIFNSGTASVTTGSLDVARLYIGKNYKGNIGTSSSLIAVDCAEFHNSSAYAGMHVNLNASESSNTTARIKDSSTLSDSMTIDGKYDAIINRTRSDIALTTDDVTSIEAHSKAVTFTASDDVTTVRLSGANATLNDGGGTVTATNRANVIAKRVNNDDTNFVIHSSRVKALASEFDGVTIYSGIVVLKGNTGAPIDVGAIFMYPNSIFDARTSAATFNPASAITVYGGRLLLDAGGHSAQA